MKFKLLEDHQVRLSDKVLKAGVYTLEELELAHSHDSLDFCMKFTKLKDKLIPHVGIEEELKPTKLKNKK